MDKINLVYFSAAGTTKTVATVLAGSMQREIIEYDLLRRPPDNSIAFEPDLPAIFAMPVYAGRIPAVCVDMLKKFRGKNTPAIAVAVYGNRDYDDALLELKDIVSENGFVVVAAAAIVAQHSIFSTVAKGRPDQRDKQKIASFGQKCNLALKEFTGTEEVAVKGNTPYREAGAVPLRPSGDSKCNACGACARICPTKAIAAGDPRKTDKTRCIACTACISVCPKKARAFHGPLYGVASKVFTSKNSARKEPEFFYSKWALSAPDDSMPQNGAGKRYTNDLQFMHAPHDQVIPVLQLEHIGVQGFCQGGQKFLPLPGVFHQQRQRVPAQVAFFVARDVH